MNLFTIPAAVVVGITDQELNRGVATADVGLRFLIGGCTRDHLLYAGAAHPGAVRWVTLLPVWDTFGSSHLCGNETEETTLPRRTACTVRTIELLADLRIRLHEHFMADGAISPVEHTILHLHDETAYMAERSDWGRRALISLLDHAEVEETRRQEDEWRQLDQLRDRIYVGHAPSPVAAG